MDQGIEALTFCGNSLYTTRLHEPSPGGLAKGRHVLWRHLLSSKITSHVPAGEGGAGQVGQVTSAAGQVPAGDAEVPEEGVGLY